MHIIIFKTFISSIFTTLGLTSGPVLVLLLEGVLMLFCVHCFAHVKLALNCLIQYLYNSALFTLLDCFTWQMH